MIKSIHISNFRSIKDLTITPEKLCALIAPNSSGKTNIFKALNVLLGETYPTEKAFSKDDFHKRDISKSIIIKIILNTPLSPVYATKKLENKKGYCEAIELKLEYQLNESGGNSAFTCMDKDGIIFYGNGQIRDQISWIYIPSERSFDKQLSMSKWTLFGKILSKVDSHFRADSERISAFEKSMLIPKSILEEDFDGGISYSKFKDTFIQKVQINVLGHINGCELNLEIYDPLWYYKMIHITSMESDQRFNVEEIGSGTQNLILLSLFQTFATLMKKNAILAIEEPELFLFPHAQRQLYKEFRNLSEESQIFYTTHCPNFVDISNCDEAIILRKIEGETIKLNTGILSDFINADEKHELHLQTKFNSAINEIFFAEKIILVEGNTEKSIIPHILEKLGGCEINIINYLVLSCESKDFIPFYIRICQFIGLENYIVLFDTDLHENKNEQNLAIARKSTNKIYNAIDGDTDKIIELNPDFETICGYSTSDKNKIRDAVNWASNVDIEKIPNEFTKLLQFVNPTISEDIEVQD